MMRWLVSKIRGRLLTRALQHPYTHLWHADDRPYMLRFWVLRIGRSRHSDSDEARPWFGVRLHILLSSDDDRAWHDHPWWWGSLILEGGYIEHTPEDRTRRDRVRTYRAGSFRIRRPDAWHRLELLPGTGHVTTLFFHGPRVRRARWGDRTSWGFLTKAGEMVPWRKFGTGVYVRDPRGPGWLAGWRRATGRPPAKRMIPDWTPRA